VSVDLELDDWRREWSHDTEVLPELRLRIQRQDRRMKVGLLALLACLVLATGVALLRPTDGWRGFALGVWGAVLVAGGYMLWVRRGTWEPAALTSQAYVDLLHRRAVAEVRKIVFIRRALAVVLIAYSGFLFLGLHHRGLREALVVSAFAVELLWIRLLERRRRRAAEEAHRLLEDMRNVSDTSESKDLP
jgi:hypothetical protein